MVVVGEDKGLMDSARKKRMPTIMPFSLSGDSADQSEGLRKKQKDTPINQLNQKRNQKSGS